MSAHLPRGTTQREIIMRETDQRNAERIKRIERENRAEREAVRLRLEARPAAPLRRRNHSFRHG